VNQDDKEKFLTSKGWHTWYNPKYWVHPDCVEDKTRMDYTNYGFILDEAFEYEKIGKPKFRFFPLPVMSQIDMCDRTKGLKENPDEPR